MLIFCKKSPFFSIYTKNLFLKKFSLAIQDEYGIIVNI